MEESAQRAASDTGPVKNGGRPAKSFACKHDGCGKRFTRLEHLNRHALNHTAGTSTCPRCRAHFKRPDLLARHMDRHRQRDEEAGGKGVLNTRKRLWKQSDGAIVQKRPVNETPSSSPAVDRSHDPLSPPVSQESSEVAPSSSQDLEFSSELLFNFEAEPPLPAPSSFQASSVHAADNSGGGDFWNSSFQGPTPSRGLLQNQTGGPYEDAFQPDTASSFNMPYTTATNYNWLFDLNPSFGMGEDTHLPQQDEPSFEVIRGVGGNMPNTSESYDSLLPFEHLSADSAQGSSPNPRGSSFALSYGSASPMGSFGPPDRNTLRSEKAKVMNLQMNSPSKPLDLVELERPLATLRRPRKSRAGQNQHNMSHLFHGLLINLIRRSDCQSVQPSGPNQAVDGQEDLEVVWRRWAEAEQKKRLALLCFLWDTQHAVLFCQSLCMSSFELRVPLPCSQSLWEAPTASEWKSHAPSFTPEPQFLTTLKSYLTPSSPRPSRLNCLSRVLILHGLMSIFWDMQRRDQTSLGVIPGAGTDGLETWRDRIARAYDLWKTDFDLHCMAVALCHQTQDPTGSDSSMKDTRQEFAVFSTSYSAIYHAAQVLLNAEFLDLQIYAGARHILSRPVQRGDYVRSERVVKAWATVDPSAAKIQPAVKAAWHAASLLRDASRNLDDFDAMGLFHVPWCLYLATLTCWAFHTAGKPRGGMREDDDEMIWDARTEMNNLIEKMAGGENVRDVVHTQGTDRTGGMVWVMANVLERVRWGIVHAGVLVLRGLVPLRLVNQYEAA
ncbi:hypothetical protein ACJ41O_001810 [Fusarium nematophilum]